MGSLILALCLYGPKHETMRAISLILVVAVSGSLALREKREDCGAQFGKYSQCLQKAVGSMAQIQPSGKPDEIARQGCNILTSIMDCKKANLKQIPGWDEDKCPAAKAGSGMAFVSM